MKVMKSMASLSVLWKQTAAMRLNTSHQAMLENLMKTSGDNIGQEVIQQAAAQISNNLDIDDEDMFEFTEDNHIRVHVKDNLDLSQKDEAAAANATADANATAAGNATATVNPYALPINWYDDLGETKPEKLKDDTPEWIKAHPVYKRMSERFMAGKFKDKDLDTFNKKTAKATINYEDIGEEKEREGLYPNDLDAEMTHYTYGERLPNNHYGYGGFGGYGGYGGYNYTDYWNNQGTLAPPFDPNYHFETPYYHYPDQKGHHYGYWAAPGFDMSTKRTPLLAQQHDTIATDQLS